LRHYPWICRIFEAFYLPFIGGAFLSHAFLVAILNKPVALAVKWMSNKLTRPEADNKELIEP
jgi:hypothetical protein